MDAIQHCPEPQHWGIAPPPVRAALAEADSPARVASIAHRLKGSAGTYGYPALSAAAAALEAAADRGGPLSADLLRAVDVELETALASLEVRSRTAAGG